MSFILVDQSLTLLAVIGGLLILAVYSILMFNKPLLGLGGLLLWIPFMKAAPKDIGVMEVCFTLMVGLTWIAFFIRFMVLKPNWRATPLDLPLFLFLLCLLVSLIPALKNGATLQEWFRQVAPYSLLSFYFFIKNEITEANDIKWLTVFFIISTMLNLMRIIYDIGTTGYLKSILELRGGLDMTAFSGINYALVGYIMGYLAINPKKHNWYYLGLLSITLVAQFITMTRGYIINVVLLTLALIWINWRYGQNKILKMKKIIYLVFVFWFAYSLLSFVENYVILPGSVIEGYNMRKDISTAKENRLREIESAIEEFKKAPLLGKGMGTTLETIKIGRHHWERHFAHNIFAYIMFTMGALGLGILFWMCGSVWYVIQKTKNHLGQNIYSGYFWGHVLGLCSLFFSAQLQGTYRHFIFNLYVALVLAILAWFYDRFHTYPVMALARYRSVTG